MRIISIKQAVCVAAFAITAASFNLEPARAQAPPAAPAAAPLDVLGIRPGMPLQDAYNLLSKIDPSAKVKVAQVSVPALGDKPLPALLQSGQDLGSPDVVQLSITLPPQKQVVWRIGRLLNYARGKELPRATILAALREKYGQESDARSGMYRWLFDEQGRRVTGNIFNLESFRMCSGFFNAVGPDEDFPPPGGAPLGRFLQNMVVNAPAQRGCRLRGVVAAFDVELNPEMASRVRLSVVDPPLGIANELATIKAIADVDGEAQRRQQEEANRRDKPKL